MNDSSELRKALLGAAHVGLVGMKELCGPGQEVAMVKFGTESLEVMQRALISEMKGRGHRPDVERWKREMRERLSPEHYPVWEKRVLPYLVRA